MFLLSLAFVSVAKAETRLVWSFDWEGIDIRIYAPPQAYPGDNITLQTIVESTEVLKNVYVTIGIHGSISEGSDEWTDYIKVLEDDDFSIGEFNDPQNFNVSIPANVSSGLIYGHIYCTWKVYRVPVWKDRSCEDSFEVTYLKSREFEQLQEMYNTLNGTYNSLLGNYTELESKYEGELGTARNLMYVFVATTVVSAATAFFFLLRRPKTVWT